MNTIQPSQLIEMLERAADTVIAQERTLCELDSHVGDGDHGVTVSRGFAAVKKALAAAPDAGIGKTLECTGDTLSETMGGAIGPIFGSIFTAMGEKAGDAAVIDAPLMRDMLAAGLEDVMLIGGAKPGDRTLVDALYPAVEAMDTALPLPQAMEQAARAAEAGMLATREMVAKKGRAMFLQEKSKGYQDAGATSLYLVLRAMADYCAQA